ncbi:MAG: DUF192 domain-containing protein [Candidatus Omnitrophica bacterium]|nr:DUF192 domain-containing protein [Candidatus Omnitrophota bacterium]
MIKNLTRQTILATCVEIAHTPLKRMRGLVGRLFLKPTEALVIAPCQSIHMLFMKFPIDVIFLDDKNKVIGQRARIKPFQFSAIFWKSACAIELPAGTIELTHTQLGDQIQIS